MSDLNDNYDPVGNNTNPPAFYQSPDSNPGVVYQPANIPTNSGALKSGQQTFQNIIWFGQDGSKLEIGNLNVDVLDNQAGIVIYGPDGQVLMIFGGGRTDGGTIRANSSSSTTALIATNDDGGLAGYFSDGGTGTDNVVEIEMANSSNTNSPLQILNAKIYNSSFRKMLNFQAGSGGITLWTGDGATSPNGVLTGGAGDVLLAGDGDKIYFCTGSTSWTSGGGSGGNLFSGSVVSNVAGPNFPAGWSVNNDGTGLYDITHNLGVSNYAVVATPNVFSEKFLIVYSKSSNDFNIGIFDRSTGNPTNEDFDFILTY